MKVESESEVAQSCPTPSDPMDCSLPGSSVHGIFQARVLEWGAIAFSKLQSYSNQNSMLLEQKQTYNSTEHNREPGSKPTFIWSFSLQQKWQEYTMGERQSLQ